MNKRIEDYDKILPIVEVYRGVQGEGLPVARGDVDFES